MSYTDSLHTDGKYKWKTIAYASHVELLSKLVLYAQSLKQYSVLEQKQWFIEEYEHALVNAPENIRYKISTFSPYLNDMFDKYANNNMSPVTIAR